jgi:hypothetical protein
MKVLAVTIAMLLGNSAFAQEDILIDAEVVPVSHMGGGDDKGCDDGKGCDYGKDVFDNCCSCGPTVYAALEIPWLQINESSITSQLLDDLINGVPGANVNEFGIPPTYGQEPSFRIYGGIENCNGFGIRGAYWQFEDSASGIVDLSGLPGGGLFIGGTTALDSIGLVSSHEFQVGDIELSQRAEFCGWNLMMTTGIRIARVQQVHAIRGTGFDINTQATGALDIGSGRDFTGAGLTASIGWEREIRSSGFGFYGNLRGSVLFGDTKYSAFAVPTGAANNGNFPSFNEEIAKVKDQPVVVTEIALGAQYERCTNYGVMFVRAGVEGQVWEFGPVALGLMDETIGLFGPTFTVGFER